MPPKFVSVVGYKGSGKTRTVEGLIQELRRRGLRVGTVKHIPSHRPDIPGKDTWRHMEAGAECVVAAGPWGTAVWTSETPVPWSVWPLWNLDFVLVEGFKQVGNMARIVVARGRGEALELSKGLEIAYVSEQELGLDAPRVEPGDWGRLADIVVEKAFPALPGLDCGLCGFPSCGKLAEAILSGKASPDSCRMLGGDVHLEVGGEAVPLNPFVRELLGSLIRTFVSKLKGVKRGSIVVRVGWS